jgi:hypothetical protein
LDKTLKMWDMASLRSTLASQQGKDVPVGEGGKTNCLTTLQGHKVSPSRPTLSPFPHLRSEEARALSPNSLPRTSAAEIGSFPVGLARCTKNSSTILPRGLRNLVRHNTPS